MTSYAIAEACGKQVWLEEGKFYDFNKLPLAKDDVFTLNNILLVNLNNCSFIGKPYLDGEFSVKLTVLRHLSAPKVRVYKMRSKKKTRKTYGERPKLTRVLVNSISRKIDAKAACYISK